MKDLLVRFYMARYFDITNEEHLVDILGCSYIGTADPQAYQKARYRVLARLRLLQSRLFGKGSSIAELSEHVVSLHDCEATIFNLARMERITDFAPESEDAEQRKVRRALRRQYREVQQEHLNRLAKSRAAAVSKADAELTQLEKLDRNKEAKNRPSRENLDNALRILRHHEAQANISWAPALNDSYNWREQIPPSRSMYASKAPGHPGTLLKKGVQR